MLNSIQVNPTPVLFGNIPDIAESSDRIVLMLRHSVRESLRGFSPDPELTEEGRTLARKCGEMLSGLGDVSFGASPRQRTRETARCMIEGGGFRTQDIHDSPELGDMIIFTRPLNYFFLRLCAMFHTNRMENVMSEYFTTGHVKGLKDMRPLAAQILKYLTATTFSSSRTVFVSHDVLAMTVLMALGVRTFTIDDWCGYMHGVLLTQDRNGVWTAAYALPDYDEGKKQRLFV